MGAVRNALQRDGLDPSIMDLDPDISVNRQLEKEKDNHPPLKDDPEYSKYFKMLSMVRSCTVKIFVSCDARQLLNFCLASTIGTSYGGCQECLPTRWA